MAGAAQSRAAVKGNARGAGRVALFSVATLGLYPLMWCYKVNREMRDFGSRVGDRQLARTKPWLSVLAFALGAVVAIPRVVTLIRTMSRVQAIERRATGAARSAAGVNAGVIAAAVLPLGVSVHRVSQLLVLAALAALAASIARIQARLNAAWIAWAAGVDDTSGPATVKRHAPAPHSASDDRRAPAPHPASDDRRAPALGLATDDPRAQLEARNRRAQELLNRVDRARANRIDPERER
jgi:hypothetical protein